MNGLTEDPGPAAAEDAARIPEWQEALADLERSLRDAGRAASALRRGLGVVPPPMPPVDLAAADAADGVPSQNGPQIKGEAGRAAFDRLWNRIESEGTGGDGGRAESSAPERTGLDLLSEQYLLTVEDREGRVDLVSLHRAILSLKGVEDLSLVSYANGVPVVSLRTEPDFDPEQIGVAVGKAMDRLCEVIPQGNGRLYLRTRAREE